MTQFNTHPSHIKLALFLACLFAIIGITLTGRPTGASNPGKSAAIKQNQFSENSVAVESKGAQIELARANSGASNRALVPLAGSITVNSTSDATNGGDGLCTLREAITAANNDTASGGSAGECAAGSGTDTITITPTGTINLTSMLPDITSNLTINGPGSGLLTLRRDTGGEYTVLTVINMTVVSISSMTITNGRPPVGSRASGGIDNAGDLTLTDVVITGNRTADGFAGSSGGYGGGIHNHNVLVMVNCVVSGNSTGNGSSGGPGGAGDGGLGGGIQNGGILTMIGSVVSGNSTGIGANAMRRGGDGGGIYSVNEATLINSTVSNNVASDQGDGGGIWVSNSLTMTNTTVTGNSARFGSGISSNASTVTLRNTIVAANGSGGTGPDAAGFYNSLGHNLVGTSDGSNGFINGINGDQVGTTAAPINPLLGPLANNGGPTETHALLAGSPALDAGDDSVTGAPLNLSTDQRGSVFSRQVDGPDADTTATVDIGAYEAQVSVEDISDKSTNQDTQLQFTFNVGGSASITSVTATSSNTTLVPNNPANIAVSGSGPTRMLTINPSPNQVGTSTITVTVNGSNGQTMGDTFLLTVNSPNHPPSFTKGPDQTVNENAETQTVNNWATNISPGPANESGQTVTFIVTNNSNPALFAIAPMISSSGTLSYTPSAGASGTANITIALMDNGGTANGGADTSPTQTFNITVREGGDLAFSSATYAIAEDGASTVITVNRTGGSAGEARINYATSNGTATAGQDYTAASGTLIFADGITTQSFNVTITNDALDETDETINLTLGAPAGSGSLGAPASAVLTINDNDPAPAISINDVAVTEGDSGTVNATFTVSLSGQSGQTVTVNFATANQTATAGSDYQASSGTVTFLALDTAETVTVTINGDFSFEPNETFFVNLSAATNATISDNQGLGTINNDDSSGGTLAFASPTFTVTEIAGSILISVNRNGDATQAVTVDYATANVTADGRKDYTPARGKLQFDAGIAAKAFPVLVNMDAFNEGSELVELTLSNPTGGAALGVPSTASLQIDNSPWTGPPANSIDDAQTFVRQHYHDFLNRDASNDPDGLAFWTNQITECQQPGATCNAELRRINVSAAFFLSIEFQETGYLVERLYKSAYGDATGTSNFGPPHQLPVPVIRFNEFLPDTQRIGKDVIVGRTGWEQVLENNKVAFILDFVSRLRFTTAYPTTMTPAEFVDTLYLHAGVTPSAAERTSVIGEFGGAGTSADTGARARVLRRVAENSTLVQQEKNRAFVLIQYFGYLRRDPNDLPDSDYSGYDFWLTKLNEFNGNFVNAEMVKAFIVSGEYRNRFGL